MREDAEEIEEAIIRYSDMAVSCADYALPKEGDPDDYMFRCGHAIDAVLFFQMSDWLQQLLDARKLIMLLQESLLSAQDIPWVVKEIKQENPNE